MAKISARLNLGSVLEGNMSIDTIMDDKWGHMDGMMSARAAAKWVVFLPSGIPKWIGKQNRLSAL